ncbi:hypothetical protein MKEN_01459200 [Mycena kentingensis (nom. inval.)]|nr:hypothetical protein MKEN_01459200 [Mycena kentingensis (nom. inval.)]
MHRATCELLQRVFMENQNLPFEILYSYATALLNTPFSQPGRAARLRALAGICASENGSGALFYAIHDLSLGEPQTQEIVWTSISLSVTQWTVTDLEHTLRFDQRLRMSGKRVMPVALNENLCDIYEHDLVVRAAMRALHELAKKSRERFELVELVPLVHLALSLDLEPIANDNLQRRFACGFIQQLASRSPSFVEDHRWFRALDKIDVDFANDRTTRRAAQFALNEISRLAQPAIQDTDTPRGFTEFPVPKIS